MKKQALAAALLMIGAYATNYNKVQPSLMLKVKVKKTSKPKKTFNFELSETATINDLRAEIKKETDIPKEEQVLKFVTADNKKLTLSWPENDMPLNEIKNFETAKSYFEIQQGYTKPKATKQLKELTNLLTELKKSPYYSDGFVHTAKKLKIKARKLHENVQWITKSLAE